MLKLVTIQHMCFVLSTTSMMVALILCNPPDCSAESTSQIGRCCKPGYLVSLPKQCDTHTLEDGQKQCGLPFEFLDPCEGTEFEKWENGCCGFIEQPSVCNITRGQNPDGTVIETQEYSYHCNVGLTAINPDCCVKTPTQGPGGGGIFMNWPFGEHCIAGGDTLACPGQCNQEIPSPRNP